MKTAFLAVAALGAFGLAACQPSDPVAEKTPADSAATDASAMTPASDGLMYPSDGPMTPDAMPAPGTTPPANDSSGTINPDGTMSNGAANPASPPPVVAPDNMSAPKGD